MEISVVGISHRSAPLEIRERLALSDAQILSLLRILREERVFDEALILSTCNRTEAYFVTPERQRDISHFEAHLAAESGCSGGLRGMGGYRCDGPKAVRHLLRVAASLDSQIVGEHDIFGQVKKAYRLALEARTARRILHKLMHQAFRAGKRVRTETALTHGNASVPQAAVSLAAKRFSTLAGRCSLVMGAGDMGRAAAESLLDTGLKEIKILNRTVSLAEALAERLREKLAEPRECPPDCPEPDCLPHARPRTCALRRPVGKDMKISAGGLGDFPAAVKRADLLLCATAGPKPIVTWKSVHPLLARRRRELLVIDIGVPRSVEERVASLRAVRLFNLNDLETVVEENLRLRRKEIPKAERIVEEETAAWGQWLDSLKVTRSIKLFKDRTQGILEAELARRAGKLPPKQLEELRRFGRSLCNKIQHQPFAHLRKCSAERTQSEVASIVELFHDLFGLDAQDEP